MAEKTSSKKRPPRLQMLDALADNEKRSPTAGTGREMDPGRGGER